MWIRLYLYARFASQTCEYIKLTLLCYNLIIASTTFPTDVTNPIDPTSTNSAASGASSTVAATSSAGGNNAAGRTWSLDGMTVIAAGAMGLGVVGGAFGVLA